MVAPWCKSELLAMADEPGGALDWVAAYEAGLAAWRSREFTAAVAAFERAKQIRKDDAASSVMIERCKRSSRIRRRRLGRHHHRPD